MTNRNFALIATILALSVFLQGTPIFSILDLKPNLALAVLLAAAMFVPEFWDFFLLTLLAFVILATFPGFGLGFLLPPVFAIAAYFLHRFLFWRRIVNLGLLIILFTVLTYLFLDWQYLIGHPFLLLGEVLYNSFASLLYFSLFLFLF